MAFWDVIKDSFDPLNNVSLYHVTSLTSNKPKFESFLFKDDLKVTMDYTLELYF